MPDWRTDGNEGLSSDFLGTTNPQPVVIKTDAVERMRILADGKIGIGLHVPAVKFHVVGNRIRLEYGGNRLDLRADGSAVDIMSEFGDLYLHSQGPAGANNVVLNPFSRSGNVGVGLANPQVKFHVAGNRLRLESGAKRLDLRADGGAVDIQSDTHNVYLHSLGPAGSNHVLINPFSQSGNVGIATQSPTDKLHVVGTVRADDFIVTSDSRLKTDVAALDGALDRLKRLRGVSFRWRPGVRRGRDMADPYRRAGMIAQEVEAVAPDLVESGVSGGFRGINLGGMLATLVEALKELARVNDEMVRRIEVLERRVAADDRRDE